MAIYHAHSGLSRRVIDCHVIYAAGLNIAIVTAAGYAHQPKRYEERYVKILHQHIKHVRAVHQAMTGHDKVLF